jgi:hypothetical protein
VDIAIQRIEYTGDRIRENWIIPETVNDPKRLLSEETADSRQKQKSE